MRLVAQVLNRDGRLRRIAGLGSTGKLELNSGEGTIQAPRTAGVRRSAKLPRDLLGSGETGPGRAAWGDTSHHLHRANCLGLDRSWARQTDEAKHRHRSRQFQCDVYGWSVAGEELVERCRRAMHASHSVGPKGPLQS